MIPDLTWLAHYEDGTTLAQGQDRWGRPASYADIDRSRLVAFDLWQGERLVVQVDLRDDSNGEVGRRRLIWRIRHQLDSAGNQAKIHLVGWQRTAGGRNIQAICYVFEDGVVMLGGQWNEGRGFMYQVVYHDFEQDLA